MNIDERLSKILELTKDEAIYKIKALMGEDRDKSTGCLKGYGEHDYCVVNTHRKNILSCVNCGDDREI